MLNTKKISPSQYKLQYINCGYFALVLAERDVADFVRAYLRLALTFSYTSCRDSTVVTLVSVKLETERNANSIIEYQMRLCLVTSNRKTTKYMCSRLCISGSN